LTFVPAFTAFAFSGSTFVSALVAVDAFAEALDARTGFASAMISTGSDLVFPFVDFDVTGFVSVTAVISLEAAFLRGLAVDFTAD
jgi:hypothetical protein